MSTNAMMSAGRMPAANNAATEESVNPQYTIMDMEGGTIIKFDKNQTQIKITGSGATLICSGSNGTLLEVTPENEVVWKYVNPTKGGYGPSRAPAGPDGFGPPGGGSLFRAHRYGPDHPALQGRDLNPDQYANINRLYAASR